MLCYQQKIIYHKIVITEWVVHPMKEKVPITKPCSEPTTFWECRCNSKIHTDCLSVHTIEHKPLLCVTPPLHFEWSFTLLHLLQKQPQVHCLADLWLLLWPFLWHKGSRLQTWQVIAKGTEPSMHQSSGQCSCRLYISQLLIHVRHSSLHQEDATFGEI